MISMDKTEVSSFLGLASYYRRFMKGLSNSGAPLLRGLFDYVNWTFDCESSLLNLKKILNFYTCFDIHGSFEGMHCFVW